MPEGHSGPYSSISRASQRSRPRGIPQSREAEGNEDYSRKGRTPIVERLYGPTCSRKDSSSPGPSEVSFSSSLSQKTPARSFFHRSFHGSPGTERSPIGIISVVFCSLTACSLKRCLAILFTWCARTNGRDSIMGAVRCWLCEK